MENPSGTTYPKAMESPPTLLVSSFGRDANDITITLDEDIYNLTVTRSNFFNLRVNGTTGANAILLREDVAIKSPSVIDLGEDSKPDEINVRFARRLFKPFVGLTVENFGPEDTMTYRGKACDYAKAVANNCGYNPAEVTVRTR